MANSVPLPAVPPTEVVPYKVLPDKVNPPWGPDPSLPLVKLYRLEKAKVLMFKANTVPLPYMPPPNVVPYSVLPDKTSPENEKAPSLLVPVAGSIDEK